WYRDSAEKRPGERLGIGHGVMVSDVDDVGVVAGDGQVVEGGESLEAPGLLVEFSDVAPPAVAVDAEDLPLQARDGGLLEGDRFPCLRRGDGGRGCVHGGNEKRRRARPLPPLGPAWRRAAVLSGS